MSNDIELDERVREIVADDGASQGYEITEPALKAIRTLIAQESDRAVIEVLELLLESGKWFTENGYYCFKCNTLTHPESYRNTSGILGIPYICSSCGEGTLTHSSHVSREQIKQTLKTYLERGAK